MRSSLAAEVNEAVAALRDNNPDPATELIVSLTSTDLAVVIHNTVQSLSLMYRCPCGNDDNHLYTLTRAGEAPADPDVADIDDICTALITAYLNRDPYGAHELLAQQAHQAQLIAAHLLVLAARPPEVNPIEHPHTTGDNPR